MLCEMCGAESASLEPRKVSGSVLRVCTSCAGMGKQTSYRESVGHRAFVAQTLEKREQKTRYKDISSDEKVLVSNYGDVVRKARERKGLDHGSLEMKISLLTKLHWVDMSIHGLIIVMEVKYIYLFGGQAFG